MKNQEVAMWIGGALLFILFVACMSISSGCKKFEIPDRPVVVDPPSSAVPVANIKTAGESTRKETTDISNAAQDIAKKDPQHEHATPLEEIKTSTVVIAKNTDVIAKSVVTLEDHQKAVDKAVAQYSEALNKQQEALATLNDQVVKLQEANHTWFVRFLYVLVGLGVFGVAAGIFFIINGSVKQGAIIAIAGACLSVASYVFLQYMIVFVVIFFTILVGSIGYTLYRNRAKVYEMATGIEALKPKLNKLEFKQIMNLAQSTKTQQELIPVVKQVVADLDPKSTV